MPKLDVQLCLDPSAPDVHDSVLFQWQQEPAARRGHHCPYIVDHATRGRRHSGKRPTSCWHPVSKIVGFENKDGSVARKVIQAKAVTLIGDSLPPDCSPLSYNVARVLSRNV